MVYCINGKDTRIIHRNLKYSFSNRSEDDKTIANGEYSKDGETVVVEFVCGGCGKIPKDNQIIDWVK
jgi:hypothetical protein